MIRTKGKSGERSSLPSPSLVGSSSVSDANIIIINEGLESNNDSDMVKVESIESVVEPSSTSSPASKPKVVSEAPSIPSSPSPSSTPTTIKFSNSEVGGAYINLVFNIVLTETKEIIGKAALISLECTKPSDISTHLSGGVLDRFSLIKLTRPRVVTDIKASIKQVGPISLVFNTSDLYKDYKQELSSLVALGKNKLSRDGSLSIDYLSIDSIEFNSLPGDRLALSSIKLVGTDRTTITSNSISLSYLDYVNNLDARSYKDSTVGGPTDFY